MMNVCEATVGGDYIPDAYHPGISRMSTVEEGGHYNPEIAEMQVKIRFSRSVIHLLFYVFKFQSL